MMGKESTSLVAIVLEELREHRRESREYREQTISDLKAISSVANGAHKRIDKYENRLWGIIAGASVGGGGVGYGLSALLRKLGLV